MPAPTIPTLPTVPARNVAEPTAYITIADTWAAALPPWGVAVKAVGDYAGEQAALTAADAIATAADRVQTGEDRTQTGLDRTAAAASAVAAAGSASTSAGWSATSTTSMALTAGAKSLTIQTGKQFTADTQIRIKRTSAPSASYAFTSVGTYTSGTGLLEFTLTADDITGSGTYTDWTVELSGGRGAAGAGVVPQSVGFTLTGGASPKTLTVDADATISDLLGGDNATNSDVVALAMAVAELKGSALGLSSGVADAFEDETGVDTAGSTGEIYSSSGDYYRNFIPAETTQTLPAMTTNTAPAGHVASASSEQNGNSQAFEAFDQVTLGGWIALNVATNEWVQRQVPTAFILGSYKVISSSDQTQTPRGFTLSGSNNGSSWTVLDTRTGLSWAGGETKTFTLSPTPTTAYSYYRLTVTQTGTNVSDLGIGELQLIQGLQTAAMSLRSVAYTALSAPTTAMINVAANLNGGTINTELVAQVSRDNGTTYSSLTMTAGRALADGTTIYTGSASVAAQPSGTAMKWRFDATSTAVAEVSAVVLQWS